MVTRDLSQVPLRAYPYLQGGRRPVSSEISRRWVRMQIIGTLVQGSQSEPFNCSQLCPSLDLIQVATAPWRHANIVSDLASTTLAKCWIIHCAFIGFITSSVGQPCIKRRWGHSPTVTGLRFRFTRAISSAALYWRKGLTACRASLKTRWTDPVPVLWHGRSACAEPS